MDAAVSLPTGDRQAALMIPRDAVIKREGRYAVFTVSDGKAAMVFVDVIGYSGINAGIKTDRLKPGDLVITRGNENIAPGRDVKVAPAVGAVDASSRRM
jgi:multidrug efflux pump subunit AcrA (membrane-fusion protein)